MIGAKLARDAIRAIVVSLAIFATAKADIGLRYFATQATSPDGNTIARVELGKPPSAGRRRGPSRVSIYKFDPVADAYTRRSHFELDASPSELLYVANDGEHFAFINLFDTTEAIRIYKGRDRLKSWDLSDFLTIEEIAACAETGSTIQWFDDGRFSRDAFHFEGPSRSIKGLEAPFTIMKSADDSVFFSGSINLKTQELKMDTANHALAE